MLNQPEDVEIIIRHGNAKLLQDFMDIIPLGTCYHVDCGDGERGNVIQGGNMIDQSGNVDCHAQDERCGPSWVNIENIQLLTFATPPEIIHAELCAKADELETQAVAARLKATNARMQALAYGKTTAPDCDGKEPHHGCSENTEAP